jgi:ABC-type sulfate transport system permease component
MNAEAAWAISVLAIVISLVALVVAVTMRGDDR